MYDEMAEKPYEVYWMTIPTYVMGLGLFKEPIP
jgi:hypothetical protein